MFQARAKVQTTLQVQATLVSANVTCDADARAQAHTPLSAHAALAGSAAQPARRDSEYPLSPRLPILVTSWRVHSCTPFAGVICRTLRCCSYGFTVVLLSRESSVELRLGTSIPAHMRDHCRDPSPCRCRSHLLTCETTERDPSPCRATSYYKSEQVVLPLVCSTFVLPRTVAAADCF